MIDPVFLAACEVARLPFDSKEWTRLTQSAQTALIYSAMRKLDAEAAAQRPLRGPRMRIDRRRVRPV